MATTTDLTELRAQVLHRLGLPSNDAMAATADLDRSINSGMRAMAADFDWPWLQVITTFSTAVGVSDYAPPAGWTRTRWLSNAGRDIDARPRRDLTRWELYSGIPRFYSVDAEQIHLSPPPDAVYVITHEYTQEEPKLVNTTDKPLCPEAYIDLLVLYAALEEAERMGEAAQQAFIKGERDSWLLRVRNHVRRTASPLRLRTRQDY